MLRGCSTAAGDKQLDGGQLLDRCHGSLRPYAQDESLVSAASCRLVRVTLHKAHPPDVPHVQLARARRADQHSTSLRICLMSNVQCPMSVYCHQSGPNHHDCFDRARWGTRTLDIGHWTLDCFSFLTLDFGLWTLD